MWICVGARVIAAIGEEFYTVGDAKRFREVAGTNDALAAINMTNT